MKFKISVLTVLFFVCLWSIPGNYAAAQIVTTSPQSVEIDMGYSVDYFWQFDTITRMGNLYSNVYLGDDVITPTVFPFEGNGFWYDSSNLYDVTVPANWSKDSTHGQGGSADFDGAGIGRRTSGADKDFVHFSSGFYYAATITGYMLHTDGDLNAFSIDVPTALVHPSVVPEPVSSILFVIGGTLLAGRRFFKRRQ